LIAVLFGAALVNVKVGGGLLLEKGYATIIGLGVAAIVAFVAGEDFVSPALCEADLMRRILPENEFTAWLATFLPHLAASGDPLFNVPRVLDRTDGKMVHLYGLALSRAWQLRLLAPYLTTDHRARIASGTRQQIEAVEREIVDGDFMSTHWLVSFAVLAVTATSEVDI